MHKKAPRSVTPIKSEAWGGGGEVMGEGPAGRTHGGGGRLDMARLEGEELDLLVRGPTAGDL